MMVGKKSILFCILFKYIISRMFSQYFIMIRVLDSKLQLFNARQLEQRSRLLSVHAQLPFCKQPLEKVEWLVDNTKSMFSRIQKEWPWNQQLDVSQKNLFYIGKNLKHEMRIFFLTFFTKVPLRWSQLLKKYLSDQHQIFITYLL